MPTFAAYADEFEKTYVLANKPSERSMKASILKHHLLPVFGEIRLDAIKMHAIEILKVDLLAKGHATLRANTVKLKTKWMRNLLSAGRREST